jgi:hypothetical protein
LLSECQRLLRRLFEEMGREVEESGDSARAAFPSTMQAALAAVAAQRAVAQETAKLLQDEDLGELSIRDLGEQQTRRTQRAVHAHELVVPP